MVTADEARRELARRELERAQQSGHPAPADDYADSWFAQLTSGLNKGVAKSLGGPIDVVNDVIVTPAIHGINAIAGTNIQPSQEPLGGSVGLARSLQDFGSIKPPSDDPAKQFGRGIMEEIGGTAITSSGALAKAPAILSEIGKIALSGIGSGVGGAIANRFAPDNPYAELFAKSLGGRIASGPLEMGRRAANQLNGAVPELERRQALLEAMYEKAGDLASLSAPAAVEYARRAFKGRPVMEGPPTKARAKRGGSGNRIWDALTAGWPATTGD
ncbi:hypothetical protein ACFWXH_14135 [Mesorhizobium sp. NPDC059054]|uniref:hypothetical protein n=1 Tax=Mesorhizobium sp. NPDC059054 TaxID=3346711 RepID=UPI0036AD75E6